MTTLSPREVAQDNRHVRLMIDRIDSDPLFAGQHWQHAASRPYERGAKIALDVIERESCFFVSAAVPGVHPEEIQIVLRDNVLTIKGICCAERPPGQESYHLRERTHGAFNRRVVFPNTINAAQVEAVCENGVLDILLPKYGTFTAPNTDCIIAGRQRGRFTRLEVIFEPM